MRKALLFLGVCLLASIKYVYAQGQSARLVTVVNYVEYSDSLGHKLRIAGDSTHYGYKKNSGNDLKFVGYEMVKGMPSFGIQGIIPVKCDSVFVCKTDERSPKIKLSSLTINEYDQRNNLVDEKIFDVSYFSNELYLFNHKIYTYDKNNNNTSITESIYDDRKDTVLHEKIRKYEYSSVNKDTAETEIDLKTGFVLTKSFFRYDGRDRIIQSHTTRWGKKMREESLNTTCSYSYDSSANIIVVKMQTHNVVDKNSYSDPQAVVTYTYKNNKIVDFDYSQRNDSTRPWSHPISTSFVYSDKGQLVSTAGKKTLGQEGTWEYNDEGQPINFTSAEEDFSPKPFTMPDGTRCFKGRLVRQYLYQPYNPSK